MKVKKVDKFQCSECEEIIEDDTDIEEVTAFRGTGVDELSEDVDDVVEEVQAFKCPSCEALSECKEELFEDVVKWECGECGELYEDKEEAKSCCK